jgi:hypothetical protein
MVQRPEDKIGVSICLRGQQGTGKTKVGEVIGRLFPPHYTRLDQAGQLTGRFSGHLDSKLMIHADEAFFAGNKTELGRLKNLVTSEVLPIERKGQDIINVPNYARLLITSNNTWVVQAAPEERRFAVFDVGGNNRQDRRFFAAMDRQLNGEGGLGRLLHELQTFDLATVDLHRIPQTDALIDQKVRTLGPIDRFFYERLRAGQLEPGQDGWSRETPKDVVHRALVEHARAHHSDRTAPTAEELSTRIGELFLDPGVSVNTITTRSRGLHDRRRCWRLPPYAECCERFERLLGIPVQRAGEDPDDPWPE